MSLHYNAVTQYLDDVTDFINSQGFHGRLRYMRHGAKKPDIMHWSEFIGDAVYENGVRSALATLLQNPCTKTAQEFNHACKCYVIETWLDDVVEYDTTE